MTQWVDAFWPEGVAGYVLAARRVGKGAEAEDFFAQVEAARFSDGTLPHIIGAKPSSDWRLDLPYPAIDGTVWAAWAHPAVDFNPFRIEASPGAAAQPSAAAAPAPDRAAELRRTVEDLERKKKLLERLEEIERMLRGLEEQL